MTTAGVFSGQKDIYFDYSSKHYFSQHPNQYQKKFQQELEADECGREPHILLFYRLLLNEGMIDSAAYTTFDQALNMNQYFNKKAIAVIAYLQRYDCMCIDCWKKPIREGTKTPMNRLHYDYKPGNVLEISIDLF